MTNRFILYRIYDDADTLLYVGATSRIVDRIYQHSREKPWWDNATKITMERCDTWEELISMEKATIQIEGPLHNEVHLKLPPRRLEQYRPKGEGSFYLRSSDGLWVGRVELPADARTGRRRYKCVTSKDKEVARQKFEALKEQVHANKG